MSGEVINLRLSGPVLSMLLLESARNHGNAQGLLFGKVNLKTENQVTDQTHTETFSQNFDVNDYSITKLRNISTNSIKPSDIERCVGLFSCRKHTSKHSLIEQAAHEKLLEQIAGGHTIVTLLITCDVLPHDHRYRWNFTAYSRIDNKFRSVKINIHNLGECKHGAYKTPTRSQHSSRVQRIVRNLSTSLDNPKSNKYTFVEETKKTTDELVHELDMSLSQLQSTQYAVNMARIEQEHLQAKLNSHKTKLLSNESRAAKMAVENCETEFNNETEENYNMSTIPNIMDQDISPTTSDVEILTNFIKPSAPMENDDNMGLSQETSKNDDFASLVHKAKQDIKFGNHTS